jgi:hypothetical protein
MTLRCLIQTEQRCPLVSSQNKNLLTNEDGLVDIYFGPKGLAGKENNRVQTIPGKGWNTLLLDGSWNPSVVKKIQ